jgi:hypothetical protein
MGNATWVAYIALLIWPVVALYLYSRLPAGHATLWTIIGGYLLLPVGAGIKIAEGIPQLDKTSIPTLAALVGCVLIAGRRLRFWNGFGVAEGLLAVLLVSPFATSLLNTDPTFSGGQLLPAVGPYEGLSAVVAQFIFVLPFFLGRQFLKNSADIETLLRTLVAAGLLYSLPMLFEMRMSPQLHYWIYGYYPSDFIQQMRDGGFRATVFIGHGLGVAFFTMTTTVAAAALWRTRTRLRNIPPAATTAYLGFILVLCKSLAPLLYAAFAGFLIHFSKPRLQLGIASTLVIFALAYPLLRTEDLVPTQYLLGVAASVSPQRAESLQVRFDNEQRLLKRASQRIVFGWGRFGRGRVFNQWGKDISITDGRWIITLGQFGVVGFLAEFGLIALAVFRSASVLKYVKVERESIQLSALALILAINLVDLLPNAALTPLTWLFTGAVFGWTDTLRRFARQRPEFARPVGIKRRTITSNAKKTPLPSQFRAP